MTRAETNYPRQAAYRRRLRAAALAILGNKCVHCGFDDPRALQIDHINGGGGKERKDTKNNQTMYYRMIIASAEEDEGKYQLLCANCNWIKRTVEDENYAYTPTDTSK